MWCGVDCFVFFVVVSSLLFFCFFLIGFMFLSFCLLVSGLIFFVLFLGLFCFLFLVFLCLLLFFCVFFFVFRLCFGVFDSVFVAWSCPSLLPCVKCFRKRRRNIGRAATGKMDMRRETQINDGKNDGVH